MSTMSELERGFERALQDMLTGVLTGAGIRWLIYAVFSMSPLLKLAAIIGMITGLISISATLSKMKHWSTDRVAGFAAGYMIGAYMFGPSLATLLVALFATIILLKRLARQHS